MYDIGGNFVLESRSEGVPITLDMFGRCHQECSVAAEMHFESLSWAKNQTKHFLSWASVAGCHAPFLYLLVNHFW